MTNSTPVALGEVLCRSDEWADIAPDRIYKEVKVKLWGKGIEMRREVIGANVREPRKRVVRKDQFLLSRIDARNGALGVVPAHLDGAIVSNDFPSFDPRAERLMPDYLNWMSKTRWFVDLCRQASEGTTNRVRLQEDRFLRMTIPVPPLPEQRRIVERIDGLASRISEARSLRRQAAEEREALVHANARDVLAAVNAEPSRLHRWLDLNREGVQTGPFGAQLSSNEFTETGIPVLTIGNIQYSGLDTRDLKYVSESKANSLTRYIVRPGDLLFARMGTVGRCCLVPKQADGWLINYHIIRVALDSRRVVPRFVHWTVQASGEIENYLGDTIRGATRQGVNSSIVAGLPCRIPSIPEQHRIVAYLDNLQEKVDALKRLQSETAAELDALLPSILDKAFRGEL